MPKYPDSQIIGRRGINCIDALCNEIGWIWRETPNSDVGFDGEIEIREGDDATAQIIKVQSKAGKSYIRNAKPDRFDYYADANHLEYWQGATNPVILVIYDPETETAYWVDVKNYLAMHPEVVDDRPHKITFDKTRDRFTPECAAAMRRVFGPDYVQAETAYRIHIVERFARLTLYSVSSDAPLAVDLERVFVKLTATQEHEQRPLIPSMDEPFSPFYAPEMVIRKKLTVGMFGHEVLDSAWIEGTSSQPPPTPTRETNAARSIADILAEHESVAIIGAAGAGKTTLLKYPRHHFCSPSSKRTTEIKRRALTCLRGIA